MQWLQYGSGYHIFICTLHDKIYQKKTRTAYFQLYHSYISMQGVNGFSPPSKRHPVAPTTLKEKGEVPIPLPVLCSHGGGSGRRQLYTKMTDHRFCCLPACLLACLPGFFLRPPSHTDFPLIQEWDVDGNARAVHYATLSPAIRDSNIRRTWLN
jgi:hypothetical protein